MTPLIIAAITPGPGNILGLLIECFNGQPWPGQETQSSDQCPGQPRIVVSAAHRVAIPDTPTDAHGTLQDEDDHGRANRVGKPTLNEGPKDAKAMSTGRAAAEPRPSRSR